MTFHAAQGRRAGAPARTRGIPLAGAVLAAASAVAAPARADEAPARDRSEPAVAWSSDWPRFGPFEYGLTAALAGGALASFFLDPTPDRWTTRFSLDTGVRRAMRLESLDARLTARGVSDVLLSAVASYPFLDAAFTAWAGHGSADVALQMTAINAQSMLVTVALGQLIKNVASRERPYGVDCRAGTGDPRECANHYRYQSFWSGHTSAAFTGAGLACAHHGHLPLYGGRGGDVAACVAALGVAATVGMLRIAGDQHYATDVVVGATMGTLSGYLLPVLLHYRTRRDPLPEGRSSGGMGALAPALAPAFTPRGFGVSGRF